MAGIRVGGIAVLQLLPDIPILGHETVANEKSIWQIGNTADPVRMNETIINSLGTGTPNLGDPQREPVTGDYVVYSRFTTTGTIERSVRLVDWADTTDIELYADATGGAALSLEPTWAPDGSKILFRAKGAGSDLNVLKDMDPDGSNVQTLNTGTGHVVQPQYSFDGTRIAWLQNNGIWVADADGTGATELVNGGSDVLGACCWMNNSLTLAYRHDQPTFTGNESWRVINDDGTGGATWLTISRASGYGPGQADPQAIMWSFLRNDDCCLVSTVRVTADPDPDARLTLIDSGGTFFITPARYASSDSGGEDLRPVCLIGMEDGTERLYFLTSDSGHDVVASVLASNGGDYRIDFDGTITSPLSTFHGFRGNTVN